jgi:hypothetical protein
MPEDSNATTPEPDAPDSADPPSPSPPPKTRGQVPARRDGQPQSISAGNSVKAATCKWSARSRGEDRTLRAQAYVYRAPSAIAAAGQGYRHALSVLECHCQRIVASVRPVAGLGDQATEVFAPRPDANFVDAPNAVLAGTNLLVRSSNADIGFTLGPTCWPPTSP